MQDEKFRDYLLDRFGITLPTEVTFEGEKSIRAMNKELKQFRTSTPKGIPASRMKGKYPKPSTAFIQLFGSLATKNTIELNLEDALSYLQGKDVKTEIPAETGYVILTHKKAVLGIGFYKVTHRSEAGQQSGQSTRSNVSENKIENMHPKGRKIRVT